jgi:tRNA threonylcarbamoyladenosine modification (KEOPS) complex  Pcc1 subunit
MTIEPAYFSPGLTIYQGATFSQLFTVKNGDGSLMNFTGKKARMQIRPTITSSVVIANLTTENGRILLGGTSGTITLTISAADTAALTAGSGVWDFELVDDTVAPAVVDRLMYGMATVNPEVTR